MLGKGPEPPKAKGVRKLSTLEYRIIGSRNKWGFENFLETNNQGVEKWRLEK